MPGVWQDAVLSELLLPDGAGRSARGGGDSPRPQLRRGRRDVPARTGVPGSTALRENQGMLLRTAVLR